MTGPRRYALLVGVSSLVIWSLDADLLAQTDDAQVLSAAIAHYSNAKRNRSEPPLLVIAGETIVADRISLRRFERAETPEIQGSTIRALRERNDEGAASWRDSPTCECARRSRCHGDDETRHACGRRDHRLVAIHARLSRLPVDATRRAGVFHALARRRWSISGRDRP